MRYKQIINSVYGASVYNSAKGREWIKGMYEAAEVRELPLSSGGLMRFSIRTESLDAIEPDDVDAHELVKELEEGRVDGFSISGDFK